MPSPRVSAARKAVALTRHRKADDPELIEAKLEHGVASIEEYVTRVVDSLPPFTEEQRARISALLAPFASEGAA